MDKINYNQFDYLDTLRYLNSKNINDSKELKDKFFDLLMVNADKFPEHIKGLTITWREGFEKEYAGEMQNWLINNLYTFQIAYQLRDTMIEDQIDCLYLDERNAHHTLTYLASIEGEKELVEKHPLGFESFKQYFLLGLITRYANYAINRNEHIERFNKLVNMYVEQQLQRQFNIETQKQLDSYIDEEFLEETKESLKTCLNINEMDSILHNLVGRKSVPYKSKSIEQLIKEYKKQLSRCTTQEEKNKIYKILNELYSETYYEYSETKQIRR